MFNKIEFDDFILFIQACAELTRQGIRFDASQGDYGIHTITLKGY